MDENEVSDLIEALRADMQAEIDRAVTDLETTIDNLRGRIQSLERGQEVCGD